MGGYHWTGNTSNSRTGTFKEIPESDDRERRLCWSPHPEFYKSFIVDQEVKRHNWRHQLVTQSRETQGKSPTRFSHQRVPKTAKEIWSHQLQVSYTSFCNLLFSIINFGIIPSLIHEFMERWIWAWKDKEDANVFISQMIKSSIPPVPFPFPHRAALMMCPSFLI